MFHGFIYLLAMKHSIKSLSEFNFSWYILFWKVQVGLFKIIPIKSFLSVIFNNCLMVLLQISHFYQSLTISCHLLNIFEALFCNYNQDDLPYKYKISLLFNWLSYQIKNDLKTILLTEIRVCILLSSYNLGVSMKYNFSCVCMCVCPL